jgi:hypothetical protein
MTQQNEQDAPIELKLAVATGYLQVCNQLTAMLDHLALNHHDMTTGEVIKAVRHWSEVTRQSVYTTVRKQAPQSVPEP